MDSAFSDVFKTQIVTVLTFSRISTIALKYKTTRMCSCES
jgi:hypothetical protein